MAKDGPPRLLLLATDGSPASEKATAYAIDRASEGNARLLVMMVVDPTLIGGLAGAGATEKDLAKDLERDARNAVNEAVERAQEAGVDAAGAVIELGAGEDGAATVVRLAKERNVNVIFVGSHGRTGMLAVMLGSTSEKIVKTAHCPVSVIR